MPYAGIAEKHCAHLKMKRVPHFPGPRPFEWCIGLCRSHLCFLRLVGKEDPRRIKSRSSRRHSAQSQITAATKSDLAGTGKSRRSKSKRQTYGVAVRGKACAAHHGNRPAANPSRTRPAHQDPARELAYLIARGASIGRIAPGHYFRGGQLLVGSLRTLRTVVRILEIDQRQQQQRAGIRMTSSE
jgi:hypothetical protein